MANKLFSSAESKWIIKYLWDELWIWYLDMYCISFAVSLIKNWKVDDLNNKIDDARWLEFNYYSLKKPELYRALLSCLYEKNISEDEFFWSHSYMKYHWDNWAKILWDIRENKAWTDKQLFLIELSLLTQ